MEQQDAFDEMAVLLDLFLQLHHALVEGVFLLVGSARKTLLLQPQILRQGTKIGQHLLKVLLETIICKRWLQSQKHLELLLVSGQ